MSRLRVVADEQILHVREALAIDGVEVETAPAGAIDRARLAGADALLVRSKTRVDADLVAGTPVRFVATATAGTDHLDLDGLSAAGIAVENAAGSNARAVGEFAVALAMIASERLRRPLRGSLGVIGLGYIGTHVADLGERLGLDVRRHDPPLEAEGAPGAWHDLAAIAACDTITVHVPLITSGEHPTRSLLDADFFRTVSQRPLVVNAARGEVVDETALRAAIADGRVAGAALDVFTDEPACRRETLDAAVLATPHMAGRSLDAMVANTVSVHDALCRHFGIEHTVDPSAWLPPRETCAVEELGSRAERAWGIGEISRRMKEAADIAATFQELRYGTPLRRDLVD